jgi:hypothetical protein
MTHVSESSYFHHWTLDSQLNLSHFGGKVKEMEKGARDLVEIDDFF